ncbi:hypothetical protein SteCoe_29569 [Stentor coeruleus]|uniref:Uncharacterized protein n=1 Tax=Stentor coeruleus TaxID=5963 RepID=A0A1R2B5J4_9CILI|nr:hypothetical protein SteCoe_29569 [Stentor coeruleus]
MKYTSFLQYKEYAQGFFKENSEAANEVKRVLRGAWKKVKGKVRKSSSFLENSYTLKEKKVIDKQSFIKRMREEHKKRWEKRRDELGKSVEKYISEERIKKEEQEKIKEMKEKEYKKKLIGMAEQRIKRKEAIRAKSERRMVQKQKKTYESIEGKYISLAQMNSYSPKTRIILNNSIKNLEKLENPKTKLFLIPNKPSDRDFSYIDYNKSFTPKIKNNKSYEKIRLSPIMQNIITRETLEKTEKAQKQEVIQSNIRRKNYYSKLVKELHQPKIDFAKQKELEVIKQRILVPVPRKLFTHSPNLRSKSLVLSSKSCNRKSTNSVEPLRPRPNYIEDMKNARKKLRSKLLEQSLNKEAFSEIEILEKSLEMDRLAKLHEIAAKSVSNNDWVDLIIFDEKANSLLLQSVQSKLALVRV